jgi:hypothetical protein
MIYNSIIKEALTGNIDVLSRVKPEMVHGIWKILYRCIHEVYTAGKQVTRDAILEQINATIKAPKLVIMTLEKAEQLTEYFIPGQIDEVLEEHVRIKCLEAAAKLTEVNKHFSRGEAEAAVREAYDQIVDLAPEEPLAEFEEDLARHFDGVESGKSVKMLDVKSKLLADIFGTKIMPRLYVVFGRPSMGKNVLVNNLVIDLLSNYTGLYFNWDNSVQEATLKVAACAAGVPYWPLLMGTSNIADKGRLARLKLGKLYLTDKKPNQYALETCIEKMIRAGKKIDFIVIDYFQKWNLQLGKGIGATEGFNQAVGNVTNCCQKFQIPIFLLAQSNDKTKKQWGKKEPSPEDELSEYKTANLNDISYCDRVAMEAYYAIGMEGKQDTEERVAFIAKVKDGSLKRVRFEFDGASSRMNGL